VSEELRELLNRKPADASVLVQSESWLRHLSKGLVTEVIAKLIAAVATR
jgi:hypothetical protein